MMRKISFVLLISLAAMVAAQNDANVDPNRDITVTALLPSSAAPSTQPPPTTPTSTEAPAPEPTTPTSTEAPAPPPTPSTSTEAPAPPPTPSTSTEAPAPQPTPTEPSTSPSSRTTSSEAPSTRPPRTPTTTKRPVVPTPPAFPNNLGEWSVTGASSPCIIMRGALQLHKNGDGNKTEVEVIDIPSGNISSVLVSGHCGTDSQTVQIDWLSNSNQSSEPVENTLTFTFAKMSDNDNKYTISSIQFSHSKSATEQIVGPFFEVPLQHSLLCNANERLQNNNGPFFVITESLQFEAFRADNLNPNMESAAQFSKAEECPADSHKSTGVILGIAVGIGLLIVVVIALGIYLFKRCRRGGYQPLDTYS